MRCVRYLPILLSLAFGAQSFAQDNKPPAAVDTLTVQLKPAAPTPPPPPAPGFTGRFTSTDLAAIIREKGASLPIAVALEQEREATLSALEKVNMGAVLAELRAYLDANFKSKFNPEHDVIYVPVATDKQVTIDTPDRAEKKFTGPSRDVAGFLVHDLSNAEYTSLVVRVVQLSRVMIDSGSPLYDRSSKEYMKARADEELKAAREKEKKAADDKKAKEEATRRVATALGLQPDGNGGWKGEPQWQRETRRFTYIIKDGKFIDRLKPLVDGINTEMDLAGFKPPGVLDRAGIYFDTDVKDVEVVLPKPRVKTFLEIADKVEQRMAEDAIISIEAVRLTDRDIFTGAVASRLNAQIQGVHDVDRFQTQNVIRELGLNALLAVANQQLQVSTLQQVAGGAFPAGVSPIQIAPPTLPPVQFAPLSTTVGSTFSVGADPIFFDGRQQSYGFSYISPDGIEHKLSFDAVDSLRQFWDRIERNLVVHKIRKSNVKTEFSVPVGPSDKKFKGLAALISQEDQKIILAAGNAVSTIDATAGTWLVIEDFEITPLPGSSTTLTEDDIEAVDTRVMLTMLLRDPFVDEDQKRTFLNTTTRTELKELLTRYFDKNGNQPVRMAREGKSYRSILEDRRKVTTEDLSIEKKEKNSVIAINFFSSQGNIVQAPGTTQLGAANDLTSFTTQLKPNQVTPLSSYVTRNSNNATGSSILTGVEQGERTDTSSSMTHLVIRVSFPTNEREQRNLLEGRHLGYFELPITKEPTSRTEIPLVTSSDHPLDRLGRMRVGMMFETLQKDRINKPQTLLNPQRFPGNVPEEVWETASTRMLMMSKLIGDSPNRDQVLGSDYYEKFITSVRSLLEYDEDFFDAPNIALRNLTEWNNPERIALALNNSPGRFALERLFVLLDEIGTLIIPDDYADQFLAKTKSSFMGPTRLTALDANELRAVRRDAAAHLLRFQQVFGDAVLEAISSELNLGSYRLERKDTLLNGPLHGMRDLVVFDLGATSDAEPEEVEYAHADFTLLKSGGYTGKWFERSFDGIEDVPNDHRQFMIVGKEILVNFDDWTVYKR